MEIIRHWPTGNEAGREKEKKEKEMENFEKILVGFSNQQKERIGKILESYSCDRDLIISDGKFIVVAIIKNFSGPHSSKGWDVRISSSIIHLFVVNGTHGKIYRHEFSPYYEYQDYPGGQTYWHEQYHAKKIQSIELIEGKWNVTVIMEEGLPQTITPYEAQSFERHYQQGEREKFFNTSMEIHTRLTYNGDPQDLDFSGLTKDHTDL